jgi:hypothetical protein
MTREDLYKYHERISLDTPKEGIWCCYYCLSTFRAQDAIDEGSDCWHCPKCRLDTACKYNLTLIQLSQMNNYWFLHGREWLKDSDGELSDDPMRHGPTLCYAKEKPCFRCDILNEVDDG